MTDIFNAAETENMINRLNRLNAASKPQWGKMSADQMLAHCNVTYELVYDNKHAKPGAIKSFLLKLFVKNLVVNEKPFKPDSRTAPEFIIAEPKHFETEKQRLIQYIEKTRQLGRAHFEGTKSHSFGPLSASEWNNMFYKHLDHHLKQFGV